MLVTYEGDGDFFVCAEETEEDFLLEFFGWPACRDRSLYVRSQAEFLDISRGALRVNEIYPNAGDLDRSRQYREDAGPLHEFEAGSSPHGVCKSVFDEEPQ